MAVMERASTNERNGMEKSDRDGEKQARRREPREKKRSERE